VRAARDWKELRALRGLNPELVLVALLVDPTPEAYAEALRSGAVAAAAWEAVPEAIVKVLAAALEGDSLIPAGVAQALAAKLPAFEDPDWVTHEELGWLRILAQGGTVQDLAGQAGYSERALYRLLHALYSRMGVSNRTEAILQASRLSGLAGLSPWGGRGAGTGGRALWRGPPSRISRALGHTPAHLLQGPTQHGDGRQPGGTVAVSLKKVGAASPSMYQRRLLRALNIDSSRRQRTAVTRKRLSRGHMRGGSWPAFSP
jgi:DNA-binding NarL/FixJ family response regulator